MNKYLLAIVVGVCLLASCSDSDTISLPDIEAVQVNILPNIGKTATIALSLSEPHEVYLDYWITGQEESIQTIHKSAGSDLHTELILTNLIENSSYDYIIRLGQLDLNQNIRHFDTPSRPDNIDEFYNEKDNQIKSDLEGHFLFHKTGHPSSILMVNGQGMVTWYRNSTNMIKVANLTHRNTLLTIESSSDQSFSDGDLILETNLAGDTLLLLQMGENDFNKIPHHDIYLNDEKHVVMLTQEVEGEFNGDGILVLDRDGRKIWEWSTFSEFTDPQLDTYVQPWANSIIEKGNYYYVSFRALSQVWKIHKVTGKVDWKLGSGGQFELADDAHFMFQHFAHFTSSDEILLFDNGAIQNRPYSRILSFSLTDQGQTLSPKTNIQLPQAYFSPFMGSVQQLNNQEYLVCSATNGVILNMDHSGQIQWKLIASDRIYRCVYIENIF